MARGAVLIEDRGYIMRESRRVLVIWMPAGRYGVLDGVLFCLPESLPRDCQERQFCQHYDYNSFTYHLDRSLRPLFMPSTDAWFLRLGCLHDDLDNHGERCAFQWIGVGVQCSAVRTHRADEPEYTVRIPSSDSSPACWECACLPILVRKLFGLGRRMNRWDGWNLLPSKG